MLVHDGILFEERDRETIELSEKPVKPRSAGAPEQVQKRTFVERPLMSALCQKQT